MLHAKQPVGWLVYQPIDMARNEWMIATLCAFAAQHGISLRLVDATASKPAVFRGRLVHTDATHPAERPDFLINRSRCVAWSAPYEAVGVPVWNTAAVTAITNDKWLTHCFLRANALPTAPTVRCCRTALPPDWWEHCAYPLVLKPCLGHGGAGVSLAHTPAEAQAAVAALPQDAFLIQRPMQTGWDMRVFVLGNAVYQAVLRTSDTDFRSNYSLGGQIQLVEPPAEILAMVQAVCAVLPLDFAGIDFLRTPEGGYVIGEIEDAVGCRMLYSLTDRDPVSDWMQRVVTHPALSKR